MSNKRNHFITYFSFVIHCVLFCSGLWGLSSMNNDNKYANDLCANLYSYSACKSVFNICVGSIGIMMQLITSLFDYNASDNVNEDKSYNHCGLFIAISNVCIFIWGCAMHFKFMDIFTNCIIYKKIMAVELIMCLFSVHFIESIFFGLLSNFVCGKQTIKKFKRN